MISNPPRAWICEMAVSPVRNPMSEDAKARYCGFHAPDPARTVREHDREAFRNANSVEAAWRYR
jgi:hypothetical protein